MMISGEQHHRVFKEKWSSLLYIFSDGFVLYWTFVLQAMRPKIRGLAQHGGPPGWLERSDLAGGILFVIDGRIGCLFHTVPVALTGAAQLRADGISSCCYIVNVFNHPSWAMSGKEGLAWYSSRPMPSLW
jgi:hypothetical protein